MKIYLLLGLFFLGFSTCKENTQDDIMNDLEEKNYTSFLELNIDGVKETFSKDLCGEKIGVLGYRKVSDSKYFYSNDGFFDENDKNSIFISLLAHTIDLPDADVLKELIENTMNHNPSQDSLFFQVSYCKNGVYYSNLYFEYDQNESNIIFNSELKVEIEHAIWNESFDCMDQWANAILKGTISGKLYDISRNDFIEIEPSKFDLLYLL